jgi:hypothetical protein
MSTQLLRRLQEEARARLPDATLTDRYLLACGGTFADTFAQSEQLTALVGQHAPAMQPTGVASYIYYNTPGAGLDAHIDTDVFTLNVIIMLEHRHTGDPSRLLIYENDGREDRVLLAPGEMLLLYAGGTVHAREDTKPGESISIVTIGFQPPEA